MVPKLSIYRIMGQSNLEFAVDKDKCKYWGVQVADVNAVISSAVHGAALTQMVEGEKAEARGVSECALGCHVIS